MNAPIAVNINFDSLSQNLGFPKGTRDPSYFEVADRFLELSEKYGFRYTIYIIGKDLENPEVRDRVRDWYQMGHEIGNHSYSHRMNLGSLRKSQLEYEVCKSHELIGSCIGAEPRGFICPGWATSPRLIRQLIATGYLYDTSLLPSPIVYPAVVKNALNHWRKPKDAIAILQRRDYLYSLNKPLTPFMADRRFRKTSAQPPNSIVVLPLPTLGRFSTAIWHTLLFVLSRKRSIRLLERYVENHEYFYYLLHPADLMDVNDLPSSAKHTIERMRTQLSRKRELLELALDLLSKSRRPFITMQQLALRFLERHSKREDRFTDEAHVTEPAG